MRRLHSCFPTRRNRRPSDTGAVTAMVLALALALSAAPAAAAPPVPDTVAYQAFLTDDAGRPIDGPVTIDFALYELAVGGTPVWTEQQTLDIDVGRLRASLGSVEPFDFPDDFGQPLYLGITVLGDTEMQPRERLESVPYAAQALNAQTLAGLPASSYFGTAGGNITGPTTIDAALEVVDSLLAQSGVKFADGSVLNSAAGVGATPLRLVVATAGGDYESIQAAVDAVRPTAEEPVIIDIMPGVYRERVALKSHMHLRGAGAAVTRVYPDTAAPTGDQDLAVIYADALQDVEISGLTLDGLTPDADPGIYGIFDDGSSVVVRDMRFENFDDGGAGVTTGCGLYAQESAPRVADSYFENNQRAGICLYKGTSALVSGSVFVANGDGSDGAGIEAAESSALIDGNRFEANNHGVLFREEGPSDGVTVVGNRFLGNGRGIVIARARAEIVGNFIDQNDPGVGAGVGIRVDDADRGARILGNTIRGHDFGIIAGTAPGTQIIGNRIDSPGVRGLTLEPIGVNPATVWGNTISNEGQPNAQPQADQLITAAGIVLESTGQGITVKTAGATLTLDANGNVSLSSDGDVTIDAAGDVGVTAGQDFNLTAARDVNIDAGRDLNLDSDLAMALNAGTSMEMTSVTDFTAESSQGTARLEGTDVKAEASATMTIKSATTALESSGQVTVKGSRIDLN